MRVPVLPQDLAVMKSIKSTIIMLRFLQKIISCIEKRQIARKQYGELNHVAMIAMENSLFWSLARIMVQ
jgi:hypothetical protein